MRKRHSVGINLASERPAKWFLHSQRRRRKGDCVGGMAAVHSTTEEAACWWAAVSIGVIMATGAWLFSVGLVARGLGSREAEG
jgi:hypothetical protein